MTFKIQPQEMNEESTLFRIKTRVPPHEVTDEMICERVRAANLSAGDMVRVVCMTHNYDEVLGQATYIVQARKESLERVQLNDHDIKQINRSDIKAARISEWWVPAAVAVEVKEPVAVEQPAKPAKTKKAA